MKLNQEQIKSLKEQFTRQKRANRRMVLFVNFGNAIHLFNEDAKLVSKQFALPMQYTNDFIEEKETLWPLLRFSTQDKNDTDIINLIISWLDNEFLPYDILKISQFTTYRKLEGQPSDDPTVCFINDRPENTDEMGQKVSGSPKTEAEITNQKLPTKVPIHSIELPSLVDNPGLWFTNQLSKPVGNISTTILKADRQRQGKDVGGQKDGIRIFKLDDGHYGINEVQDGRRSITYRLSDEDARRYIEGIKNTTPEEHHHWLNALAEIYIRKGYIPNTQETSSPIFALPDISPRLRERISHVQIFALRDNQNYAVRAVIDGTMMTSRIIGKADQRAYFHNKDSLMYEECSERKVRLAAIYYKEELSGERIDF